MIPSQRRAKPGLPQDSVTASGAPGSGLGTFDLRQLRVLRELAEKHLSAALSENRLVAAADPNQFITDEMINEFIDVSFGMWADGTDLLLSLIPETINPTPLLDSIVTNAVKDASSSYYDVLNKLIGDKAFKTLREPIFGEFLKGNQVQYGDVRPLLVSLGGGSPDVETQLMGGVTTGSIAKNWLGQNGVQLTDQKIWLYGYDDEPRRSFQGHMQMDGLVFIDWDDEGLKVAPQDYWLRTPTYFAGDHHGCACVIAPYVPNFGDEYQIEV